MMYLAPERFAVSMGIGLRAAQLAFRNAANGKPWKGQHLPVIALDGHGAGAGGKVWALAVDRCEPALKAKLGVFDGPVEPGFNGGLKASIEPWRWEEQADRMRVVAPILRHPKRSAERVAAYQTATAALHLIRGVPTRLAETTIRDWVRTVETKGAAGLLPPVRADKGKARALVTRDWDGAVGLDVAECERIAAALARVAAGYVSKGKSHRKLITLCEAQLFDLSQDAGCTLSPAELRRACKLNIRWARRFDEYRKVAMHDRDHKAFSDRHSPRISRTMEEVPMNVLFGDVHHVDMVIAPRSEPMTVKLIAWMDAATGYLWATPVLVNNRQGIRQEDVAKSLAQVCFCPWGGIARTFILDHGSEYKAMAEAVGRLAYLSDGNPAFGVVKCRPYSPESKGRLEGSFQIFKGIIKDLPGYIGGDRMNKPTQSKGKPVPPYPYGPEQLLRDIARAVDIYNGTVQHGMLEGRSPWEAFGEKAKASGFSARVPDEVTFDFVFSRQITRDVRNGQIKINGQPYSGDILGRRGFLGAKKVPVMVPLRDPTGPVLVLHDGKIHTLVTEAYSHTGGEGARRQGELSKIVNETIRELRSEADLTVNPFEDHYRLSHKGPVPCAPPEQWTMGALVKLTSRKTEVEERDERARSILDQIAALDVEIEADKKRAISGGNH